MSERAVLRRQLLIERSSYQEVIVEGVRWNRGFSQSQGLLIGPPTVPAKQQDLACHDVDGFKFYAKLWGYQTSIHTIFQDFFFCLVCLQLKHKIAFFIHLYKKYTFFCINYYKFLQDFNCAQAYASLCCTNGFYLMRRQAWSQRLQNGQGGRCLGTHAISHGIKPLMQVILSLFY